MGADELQVWAAYEELYGIPDGYFTTGQVCATVARSFSGAKVGPEDFVPYFRASGAARRQTPAEMLAVMGHLTTVQNATAKGATRG